MSRRRREIRKRKKDQEQAQQPVVSSDASPDVVLDESGDVPGDVSGFEQEDTAVESAEPIVEVFSDGPGEAEFDSSMVVAPSPPVAAKVSKKVRREEPPPAKRVSESSWLGQNKENLLLGMLVLYVFLLGLGTVGELFEIEWILNLPLFR